MDSSVAAGGDQNEPSGSSGTNKNANHNNNKVSGPIPIRRIHIHPIKSNIIDKIRVYFETYGEVESFIVEKNYDFYYGLVQFKDAAVVGTILLKKRHRIGRCEINARAAYPHQQPDHILNALNLNDGSIFRKIFKLLDLSDLVNVAEVCTCFNREAKAMFPSSKYKHMVFIGTEFDDQPGKMKTAIRHFGEHIQSLSFESETRDYGYLLRAIIKYCTEKLTELRLNCFIFLEEDSPELGPLFSRLEKLELVNCKIWMKLNQSLAGCVKLKVLRLIGCQLKDYDNNFGQTFLSLQEANFTNTRLTAKVFRRFIESNPSIIKLIINTKDHRTNAIQLIVQNIPNLQELLFFATSSYFSNFQDDILNIGQLKQLRVLKMCFNEFEAAPLLSALCANNAPIEHLKLNDVWIANDEVECILKLDRLEVLELNIVTGLANDHLVRLAKCLPELQELHLSDVVDLNLTLVDLKKIVSHANKLKFMRLWSCGNLTIDIDDYNVLLCIVQNRREKVKLLIEIESDSCIVNVPEDILNEHRHEFFIEEKTTRPDEIISFDSNDDDLSGSSSDLSDSSSDTTEFEDSMYNDDAPPVVMPGGILVCHFTEIGIQRNYVQFQ